MNKFYFKHKKAVDSGVPIVQETVEQYLARGKKITVIDSQTFDFQAHQEKQSQRWVGKKPVSKSHRIGNRNSAARVQDAIDDQSLGLDFEL